MKKRTREYVKTLSKNLSLLGNGAVYSYETVHDGIGASLNGDMFIVSPKTAISIPGERSSVVAAPGELRSICTDGKYVFACSVTMLYCFSADDLSTVLWSEAPPPWGSFREVKCNGNHVVVRTGDYVISYLSDGSSDGSIFVDDGVSCVDLNNSIVVLGSAAGNIQAYDLNDGMAFLWSAGTLDVPRSVAVSDKMVVCTTEANADNAITFDLSGSDYVWSNWGTGDTLYREFLCSDGDDLIYYSDDQQLKYVHLDCVLYVPEVSWSSTSVTSYGKMVCDGDTIYAVDGKGMKAIDKWSSGVLWEVSSAGYDDGASIVDICTDGYRIIAIIDDPVLGDSLGYIGTGSLAKIFVKVSGTDESRYPFFNLALPVPSFSHRRAKWGYYIPV